MIYPRASIIGVIFLLAGTLAIAAPYHNLSGSWQGRWDGIYLMRLHIDLQSPEAFAVRYEWQEQAQGPMHSRQDQAQVLNANTLKIERIYIIARDQNHALAIGVFKQHTRIATLSRINKPE